ncbi:carboxymuconolactone decarboxylase family protein [Archangium lansingense]|uniref:Carboxymuconolactone decarboxylase family protein n=1 Tax=Archangium lansingense TaxID=2995310 RepID=A0ABT4AMF1_9BACT|nr:carboxymuconolactone decarboxylase family protein [Archangium lansinium]MCY1082853.1 carboxymuconolactone decarboxylase family protein [Archangium lansinium]
MQQWGGLVDEIRQGDVVRIPPNVKHWHGAAPTTSMAHIAIVEQLDGKSTDWMEKVTEEQYRMPVRGPSAPQASTQTAQLTPAQKVIGNLSPKLVELTDEVLFGDVWTRPELSPRDRSLVTVSALIAMNQEWCQTTRRDDSDTLRCRNEFFDTSRGPERNFPRRSVWPRQSEGKACGG